MNMMDMARMEEVARENWEEQLAGFPRNEEHERIPYQLFQTGFIAGAQWRDKQPAIIGVDLASGPDRTVIWPNAEADRAAEDEG